MSIPASDVQTLAFYHSLAVRLQTGHMSPDEADQIARQGFNRDSSVAVIQQLRMEAERDIWHMPRQSWALAHIAYAASQGGAEDVFLAEAALTLATALNALGRFAEAIPLLHTAMERFTTHDLPECTSRCNSEVALAYTYLAHFEEAQAALNLARDSLSDLDDTQASGTSHPAGASLAQAYYSRAEGLFHLAHNRYTEAAASLRRAGDAFAANGRQGEAALTWCDLAETMRYVDTEEALDWLDRARHISVAGASCVHTARCDHVLALIYDELNRYTESLALYRQVRPVFAQETMQFLAAFCDMHQGIAHFRLNQYDEALQIYNQARASFTTQGLSSHVAMCDLNIAIVYYVMNRYTEAIALYQQVAQEAQAEGRTLRAARCYTNMGQCYDRLGHYDRALVLHDRARQAFLEAGSPVYAALCQDNLAGTYRALGRYDLALTHYRQARETFLEGQLPVYAAYCNMQMADLYLALGQPAEAKGCLEDAHRVYSQEGMTVRQALCERLLARVAHTLDEHEMALVYLARARETLASQDMVVEVALCDLIEGKIWLETDEIRRAAELFQGAQAVLSPGFPDQAWRAEEGLGRCALAQGARQVALDHYTLAVGFITRARDTLPTERLSGDFFASRQYIFQIAIELALELDEVEHALCLVEIAKARTLLTRSRPLRLHPDLETDPYLAGLVAREETLRRQLDTLRDRLTLRDKRDEPLYDELATRGEQGIALQELADLNREYEEVVDQLRLATSSAVIPPPPFSIAAFREAAAAHLAGGWACLEYFLSRDRLVIFYLDAQTLRVYTHHLTAYDHLILHQCVSAEPERRELIYRGTIRGFTAPGNLGQAYRRHLGRLLVPPEILFQPVKDLLILVPHGALHGLPFQALLVEEKMLVELAPTLYVPSLQTLQTLWAREADTTTGTMTPLTCGLRDFGGRARPLPYADREAQAVVNICGGGGQALYGEEATASRLKHMSASGQLAHYDVVHFATHAVTEPAAPMLSRVLLADEGLTVTEILELQMAARLVTLSTCQTAVGEVKPGDEMMTLARAFFYAGAQAVVASLWAVEDEATEALMRHFYERLQAGDTIPQSLREAQIALYYQGYTVYQWAPFLAIGRP